MPTKRKAISTKRLGKTRLRVRNYQKLSTEELKRLVQTEGDPRALSEQQRRANIKATRFGQRLNL